MAKSDGWGANRGQTFPVEVLTPEEVDLLIRSCSTRGSAGIRDAGLVATLYFAGLRVQEALDLLPRDLDLAAGTINVQRGKGGRQRVATLIGSAGGALIQRWLDRRHKLGLSGRCRLFCTLFGTPTAQSNVRQAFQRLKERAGIEKRVHPHGLRHSHAHYLSMTGKVPLTAIQGQLGHTNLTTTARYLDHLAPEARVAILRGID